MSQEDDSAVAAERFRVVESSQCLQHLLTRYGARTMLDFGADGGRNINAVGRHCVQAGMVVRFIRSPANHHTLIVSTVLVQAVFDHVVNP